MVTDEGTVASDVSLLDQLTVNELAVDLNEIYASLNELCTALQGGGIVQARDIEPSLAKAMPVLRHAVTTLNEASDRGDDTGSQADITASGRSPRLM